MSHMFKLRDTQFSEAHQDWLGRPVIDRYGRTIGQVIDLLVEERPFEDAVRRDQDANAWTLRAAYAVVRVGNGWLGRFSKRKVLLPVASMRHEDGVLRTQEDGDYIRLTLAA